MILSIFISLINFLSIISFLFLTHLICGKGKKQKKSRKSKSDSNRQQIYDNLAPLEAPIQVKEDKDKEDEIRQGKLVKNIRDPQYDTMRDLNKLDELEKPTQKSVDKPKTEEDWQPIEKDPGEVEEAQEKPKPKPKRPKVASKVDPEKNTPSVEEDNDDPPPSSKRKGSPKQKRAKAVASQQDDENPESAKRKPPTKTTNDITAKDRKAAMWDVKEDEDKKKRIQKGLTAAPRDPNYQTLNLEELDLNDEDMMKDQRPKSYGEAIEKKVKKIREGAVVNPRDPLYDTFKGDMLLPELENDPVLPH